MVALSNPGGAGVGVQDPRWGWERERTGRAGTRVHLPVLTVSDVHRGAAHGGVYHVQQKV